MIANKILDILSKIHADDAESLKIATLTYHFVAQIPDLAWQINRLSNESRDIWRSLLKNR